MAGVDEEEAAVSGTVVGEVETGAGAAAAAASAIGAGAGTGPSVAVLSSREDGTDAVNSDYYSAVGVQIRGYNKSIVESVIEAIDSNDEDGDSRRHCWYSVSSSQAHEILKSVESTSGLVVQQGRKHRRGIHEHILERSIVRSKQGNVRLDDLVHICQTI